MKTQKINVNTAQGKFHEEEEAGVFETYLIR